MKTYMVRAQKFVLTTLMLLFILSSGVSCATAPKEADLARLELLIGQTQTEVFEQLGLTEIKGEQGIVARYNESHDRYGLNYSVYDVENSYLLFGRPASLQLDFIHVGDEKRFSSYCFIYKDMSQEKFEELKDKLESDLGPWNDDVVHDVITPPTEGMYQYKQTYWWYQPGLMTRSELAFIQHIAGVDYFHLNPEEPDVPANAQHVSALSVTATYYKDRCSVIVYFGWRMADWFYLIEYTKDTELGFLYPYDIETQISKSRDDVFAALDAKKYKTMKNGNIMIPYKLLGEDMSIILRFNNDQVLYAFEYVSAPLNDEAYELMAWRIYDFLGRIYLPSQGGAPTLLGGRRSGMAAQGKHAAFIDRCEAVWQNSGHWYRDLSAYPDEFLSDEDAIASVILIEGEPVEGGRVLTVRFDIL